MHSRTSAFVALAAAVSVLPLAASAAVPTARALPKMQPHLQVMNKPGGRPKPLGPVRMSEPGIAQIDKLISDDLTAAGLAGASLAVLKDGKLVYAQGYTRAAAGQATYPSGDVKAGSTYFRQASVSKTFAAIALYQLLQEKNPGLPQGLDTRIVDILKPGLSVNGIKVTDAQFEKITVRHLLDHSSGLDADVVWQDSTVAAAANHPLPAKVEDLVHYLAKHKLAATPVGSSFFYNNAGYFLLGVVVSQLRGQPWTPEGFVAALKKPMLDRLHMAHVRPAQSLQSQQLAGEARYEIFAGQQGANVMVPNGGQVPVGYGDANLANLGGAGGLSASAVDVARLVATLTLKTGNPIFSAGTRKLMFDNGVQTLANPDNHPSDGKRAGHGFDDVTTAGDGEWHGQKGGYLSTSQNMIYFETEKGGISYVLCWAGHTIDQSWYPRFDALLNFARGHDWGTTDLFPHFGMPPFGGPILLGPVHAPTGNGRAITPKPGAVAHPPVPH